MLTDADISYIRTKIIKRFGDGWLYFTFFIFGKIIRNHYIDIIDCPDTCSDGLSNFLNAYYHGYCIYLGFLIITLLGFCYPKLETIFRIVNILFFAVYFFGLFVYGNLILYQLEDKCKKQYLEMRLFVSAYVIAWYCYLATRIMMFIMYLAKKNLTGRQHGLEGTSLFVDAN